MLSTSHFLCVDYYVIRALAFLLSLDCYLLLSTLFPRVQLRVRCGTVVLVICTLVGSFGNRWDHLNHVRKCPLVMSLKFMYLHIEISFIYINLIRLLILLICVCKPQSYVSIVIPHFAGILSGLQSSVPHAYTHRRKLSCLPL